MGPSFTFAVEESASAECGAFVGTIPGVLSATFGRTFTIEHAQGFTHCLVVTFDQPQRVRSVKLTTETDAEHDLQLETYGPHPAHQAWAGKYVTPHKSDILKVDIDALVHGAKI